MAASGGTKAVVAALFANLGIAVAKFLGFAVTRSSSMLAEGVHSLADTGNQVLLLVGGRRARREADDLRQFGYGRERYFWAFVVAIVLFLLGGAFALYEGVEKLRHPHPIQSPGWAIGILVFGIVVESWSFRTAIVEADRLRRGSSWWAFVRHTKVPELAVVLLEDLGALLGLVIALVAVVVATVTGASVWDGVGTVAIGALLLVIAVVIALEMKSLLIGEAASRSDVDAIRVAVEGSDDVVSLIHLRTEHLGPDEVLVAAKVEFAHHLAVPALADAVEALEARVRAAVPAVGPLFVEPDLRRPVGRAAPGTATGTARDR